VVGAALGTCNFGLQAKSLVPSATASSIKVAGHNAYLPGAVHSLLRGEQGLAVTQSALTATFAVAASGDVTVTESATLMRCSVSDTFPPTSTSCPSLVSTGVRFTRTLTVFRAGHQVKIRDAFASTDGAAHALTLEYQFATSPTNSGSAGYTYPTHSATFATSIPSQTVTGFGTAAGSMLQRSDIYAAVDEPTADTTAYTWSRPPSSVNFAASNERAFDMKYAVSVPAAGTAFLGFAESENNTTTGAKNLAVLAVADMVNAPTITSPANGASITGTSTTVNGGIKAGGNGLPTSVVVNGHNATITKTSASTATYHVEFTEAVGTHTITATAHDSAGNVRSTSITVTNH